MVSATWFGPASTSNDCSGAYNHSIPWGLDVTLCKACFAEALTRKFTAATAQAPLCPPMLLLFGKSLQVRSKPHIYGSELACLSVVCISRFGARSEKSCSYSVVGRCRNLCLGIPQTWVSSSNRSCFQGCPAIRIMCDGEGGGRSKSEELPRARL